MMVAVNGYIDNNKVIVNEDIADWQGRNVVLTVLDSLWQQPSLDSLTSDDSRKQAALELAGLWKDHDNELSVEENVRNMRRGRRFDY